jgi:hypothetical protein
MTDPRLVDGHRFYGAVVIFPHRCPGDGCAIAAWCDQHIARKFYYDETDVDDGAEGTADAVDSTQR